jgi:hypothetical protein
MAPYSIDLRERVIRAWDATVDADAAGGNVRREPRVGPAGAIRCKAPRHRWHSRQPRHYGICKLQNPKDLTEFESHPLRHL